MPGRASGVGGARVCVPAKGHELRWNAAGVTCCCVLFPQRVIGSRYYSRTSIHRTAACYAVERTAPFAFTRIVSHAKRATVGCSGDTLLRAGFIAGSALLALQVAGLKNDFAIDDRTLC